MSVFIHPCSKKQRRAHLVLAQSWRGCLCARASDVCALQMCVCVCVCALQMCVCVCVCVCALQMCVCVCVCTSDVCACASDVCVENFSHSTRLLLQQSRASFILSLCLRTVLISSPDTWDWTRIHALAVMHSRTLCENVVSAKIKVPFYTTDIDILRVASIIVSSYIVLIYWSISMNPYTPNRNRWIVSHCLAAASYVSSMYRRLCIEMRIASASVLEMYIPNIYYIHFCNQTLCKNLTHTFTFNHLATWKWDKQQPPITSH